MKLSTLLFLFMMTSCLPNPKLKRDGATSGTISNTPQSVNPYYGRILESNPIVLTGNSQLEYDVNLNTLLTTDQTFISSTGILQAPCLNVNPCFSTLQHEYADPLEPNQNTWAFDANSSEFLQVHTFGHMKKIIDQFLENLELAYGQDFSLGGLYTKSLPENLFTSNAFWKMSQQNLVGYSECDLLNNASYHAAHFSICLGRDSQYTQLKVAQDPSVIYHETGHAFIDILMNTRNVSSGTILRSELGHLSFDEAGAIGEGLSDYFSYFVNKRTHFAEWAFGRYLNASRPLREEDPLHAPGISLEEDSRLSYPHYLFYDVYAPTEKIVNIHYAGQIISHYLVELTQDLMAECSIDEEGAIQIVFHILSEVLAEKGDLSSLGSDSNSYSSVNLTPNHAKLWQRDVRPIDFRSFAQGMAKFLKLIYGDGNRCNGNNYSRDRIEQVLDMYGLLLFKTYNEDGNGSDYNSSTGKLNAHSGNHTSISSLNRKNTILISKELIGFDQNSNKTRFYIFDDNASMQNVLGELIANGQIAGISNQLEGLPYNNGNGTISPGEFLGVALNLENFSNSPIAGVRVLGNDWDHTKNGKPCNNLGDNFPTENEGGADISSENSSSPNVGDCSYTTRSNGDDGDSISPICLVQLGESEATRWGTQEELRRSISLDSSKCLGGSESTSDCFIRSVPGASTAVYSKIDAQSSWAETVANENQAPEFHVSNLIFLETNPWIPPGTRFLCRLRVTFSNCSDCHTNSDEENDDYADYIYSGGRPFKILHLDFTVID